MKVQLAFNDKNTNAYCTKIEHYLVFYMRFKSYYEEPSLLVYDNFEEFLESDCVVYYQEDEGEESYEVSQTQVKNCMHYMKNLQYTFVINLKQGYSIEIDGNILKDILILK